MVARNLQLIVASATLAITDAQELTCGLGVPPAEIIMFRYAPGESLLIRSIHFWGPVNTTTQFKRRYIVLIVT